MQNGSHLACISTFQLHHKYTRHKVNQLVRTCAHAYTDRETE